MSTLFFPYLKNTIHKQTYTANQTHFSFGKTLQVCFKFKNMVLKCGLLALVPYYLSQEVQGFRTSHHHQWSRY